MRYILIFLISISLLSIMRIFCELYFPSNFSIIWYGGFLQALLLFLLIQIIWSKIIDEVVKILRKITKKEKKENE